MFLLPFVFAGCFILSVLNPRYAATLISQAIPQTRLLGRAVSPIVGFLSGSGLPGPQHLVSIWRPLSLPSSYNATETITFGQLHHRPTSTPGIYGSVHSSFRTLTLGEACFDESFDTSTERTEGLELLVLFLLLCLLWGACSSFVDKFRVPQPLLTAASVVDDIVPLPGPRALTPSTSVEFGEFRLDDSEEESDPIPAQLNFVTPDGDELSNRSPFILNTRAATDAILAIPLRVCPGSMSPPSGSLNELEEQIANASTTSPNVHMPVQNDNMSSGMAQGIARLMSMSQARPALYNPRQQGPLRVAKSTSGEDSTPHPDEISAPDVGKTRHAVVSNPPLMLPEPLAVVNEEDFNARAPPRARSRTYCVLSPLFEEAVTFTVVNSMGAKSQSRTGPLPLMPTSTSGPLHASIEEVPEAAQRCSADIPPQTAESADPIRVRPPQRQQRPKKPPVTVWPRIPLEARRSRTPSSQPIRMNTDESTTGSWDQPRRSRTVTGI